MHDAQIQGSCLCCTSDCCSKRCGSWYVQHVAVCVLTLRRPRCKSMITSAVENIIRLLLDLWANHHPSIPAAA
jgi:hypothetical protein